MRLTAVLLSVVAALTAGSLARGAMVAHYSFNEGAGITSINNVGGLFGTLVGGAGWSPSGVHGGALSLPNGGNDYFDGNTDPSFLVSQGSLELWYKLTSFGGGAPGGMPYGDGASWDNPWVGLSTHIQNDGNKVRPIGHTNVNGPGGYKPVGNVSGVFDRDPNWVHIAVTNDGIDARFYKNGILIDTNPTGGPIAYSGSPHLAVGVRSTSAKGEYFAGGLIDEVALYNHVLTPAEVLDHYNNPIPEPATWILAVLGAAGALVVRRRSRRGVQRPVQ